MRNVWRAPCPDPFSILFCMFKIYNDSYAFGHTCPSDHTVRNVWRASPFGSAGPLGQHLGRPGRQGRPRTPERVRPGTVWAANVAQRCPPDLTSACPRLHHHFRSGIFSVGGSAVHMKCPDDVGREAGIGTTLDWEELKVFRACP